MPVLSKYGYNDIAYRLLLETTFPSWGYMIENNATSMWEHWDGWTTQNKFLNVGMNSFNHPVFGSVGRWLYQYMVGLDTDEDEVGFGKIIIKPYIGLGVNKVSAVHHSVQGEIKIEWSVIDNTFHLQVR